MDRKVLGKVDPDDGSAPPSVVGREDGLERAGVYLIQIKKSKEEDWSEWASLIHGSDDLFLDLFSTKEKAHDFWNSRPSETKKLLHRARVQYVSETVLDGLIKICKQEKIKPRLDPHPSSNQLDKGRWQWTSRPEWL